MLAVVDRSQGSDPPKSSQCDGTGKQWHDGVDFSPAQVDNAQTNGWCGRKRKEARRKQTSVDDDKIKSLFLEGGVQKGWVAAGRFGAHNLLGNENKVY